MGKIITLSWVKSIRNIFQDPRYTSGRWGKGYLDEKQDFLLLVDNGYRDDHTDVVKAAQTIRAEIEILLHRGMHILIIESFKFQLSGP